MREKNTMIWQTLKSWCFDITKLSNHDVTRPRLNNDFYETIKSWHQDLLTWSNHDIKKQASKFGITKQLSNMKTYIKMKMTVYPKILPSEIPFHIFQNIRWDIWSEYCYYCSPQLSVHRSVYRNHTWSRFFWIKMIYFAWISFLWCIYDSA